MPFTLSVVHKPQYLLVEASGPAVLADLCALMDLVGTAATMTGQTRALLDLVDVSIALTFTEHLHLGAHTADKLRSMERVASVVSVENRKGTSEKAAQHLGLHFKTFTSLEEGQEWITDGGASASASLSNP